jgi:uncharacterized membrane protein
MTTVTVWKFDDPDGAQRAVGRLGEATSEGLVTIVDHAVVTWPKDAARPEAEHSHGEAKGGAARGVLWGVLAGALLTVPVVGGVVGAVIGARRRRRGGSGISQADLDRIRTEVTPGTSALFLVTEEGDLDALGERLRLANKTLLRTELTDADQATLAETEGR